MRKKKISESIGNIDQKYIDEATAYAEEGKVVRSPAWIRWGVVAACFVLIAAIGFGVFQSGLFGSGEQIAALDNGSKIHFVKSVAGAVQLDIAFQIETRELSDCEIEALFGDMSVSAYAIFDAENGSVIGLEGTVNNMKWIVSAPGININDAVVEGEEFASDVDGITVNAGYFTSGRTAIYYATFTLGDNTVYIEHAGAKDQSDTVKNEIAAVIQAFVALNPIDLTEISK